MENKFEKIVKELVKDKNITDISYNGKTINIQDNKKGRYLLDINIEQEEIERYIKQISYDKNEQFNDENPILDTEYPNMRINAIHNSISDYGSTVSIRISKPELKIKEIDDEFAPTVLFSFLQNCVKAKCNILISGITGSGKTEFQKFLIKYIENNEKIVLIEDTMDMYIKDIFPDKDILSWKLNNALKEPIDYNILIKAGLRNNPDWIIVSETRGAEAYQMLKASQSGHKIITTLHSGSAESNVDRLIHMCREDNKIDEQILGKMISRTFDIGIHLESDFTEKGISRYISEVVEYVDYGKDGVITNKLFERKNIYKNNSYSIENNYGKISNSLKEKFIKEKLINSNTKKFVREED